MGMKPLRSVVAIIACGFLVPTLISATGCKKDEPPPPLPAAPPAASTPAATTQTLELAPEPVPSESAEPKKATGTGVPGTSLKKCCDALAQNAKGAPPPNDTLMLQASQACNVAVAAGAASPAVMAAVRAAMGGAALPAGCQ
jgi:hypothetical protein